MAARILEAYGEVDIRRRLADVTVPTLVLHCRHDACIRSSWAASWRRHSGARFIELDSRNHVLLENEPAWPRFCEAVDEFVGVRAQAATRVARRAPWSSGTDTRERRILELVATA